MRSESSPVPSQVLRMLWVHCGPPPCGIAKTALEMHASPASRVVDPAVVPLAGMLEILILNLHPLWHNYTSSPRRLHRLLRLKHENIFSVYVIINKIGEPPRERAVRRTIPLPPAFWYSHPIIVTGSSGTVYQFPERFVTLCLVGLTTEWHRWRPEPVSGCLSRLSFHRASLETPFSTTLKASCGS